jgi:hypothetical protein
MAKSSVIPVRIQLQDVGIYGNKSALVLFWLLTHLQNQRQGFSINETARNAEVSIGQVYKVIKQLELDGIVKAKGFRTNKRFYFELPGKLLVDWLQRYHLLKKVKSRGFAATSQINETTLLELRRHKIVPALHASCKELFGIKSTNIKGSEFYVKNWDDLQKISTSLGLVEMERGYEILFLSPYYSTLVKKILDQNQRKIWMGSYEILTFLDLCHYPLRGLEQAEALYRKSVLLTSICRWKEIENACR